MVIQITWSNENGGSGFAEPLDHGSNTSSDVTDPETVYIRHNGDNPITNCALYVRQFVGSTGDGATYSGDASALDDFNEIVSWGDAASAGDFGGFQVNMNATGGFPVSSWPTLSDKTTPDGQGYVTRSGVAIGADSAVVLTTETGCSSAGVIPIGNSNVRFQARVKIPSSVATAGVRMFEQVLKFTFTS